MLNVTTLTALLQMQNTSISRTVLLKTNLVNCLVALTLEKTSNIAGMICFMILVFSPRSNDQEEFVAKRITDDEYRKLLQSLNEKQRQFFLLCFALN